MKILMKVDVIRLIGVELKVPREGDLSWNEFEITEDAVDQLVADGFQPVGPLEFNLYDAGLAGSQPQE